MIFQGGGGGGLDPLSSPLDPCIGKSYEKNSSTHNTNNENHPEGAVRSGFTQFSKNRVYPAQPSPGGTA